MAIEGKVTITDLVGRVYLASIRTGTDLSPSDVAFIISTFLEGMAHNTPGYGEIDTWLLRIADEVNSVNDEN